MVNNNTCIIALVLAITVFIIFCMYYCRKIFSKSSIKNEQKKTALVLKDSSRKPMTLSVGNRQRLRTHNRMQYDSDHAIMQKNNVETSENHEKKIGVKKARKLEEKKLKKEQRDIEEREKAIKKKLDEDLAAKERLVKELEQKEILELEAKIEAETKFKEQQELELYEKLKLDFVIEVEGTVCKSDIEEKEKKLNDEILRYLNQIKSIMIEDLAGYFGLKTQICADKVKDFIKTGNITGVIDDRGKFIQVTMEEYEKVMKFILQRGRINIKELVDNSHKLVRLY